MVTGKDIQLSDLPSEFLNAKNNQVKGPSVINGNPTQEGST